MNFIDELKNKEDELLLISGLRDKCFFFYLTERRIDIGNMEQLSPIDEICIEIFSKSNKNILDKIQSQLKQKAYKGMHITKNPISLFAICLYDESIKKQYLETFFNSSSLKNKFLINILFPEYKLSNKENVLSDFEKSILPMIINPNSENAQEYFLEAFKKVEDLIDLFILENCYKNYLFYQPITNVQEQLTIAENQLKRIHKRGKILVNIFTGFIFLIIIPYISYELFLFLDSNYENLELEKFSSIVPIVFLLLNITVIYLRKKLKWIDNVLDKFENLLFSIYYFFLGLRYKEIKKIINTKDSK